MDGLLERLDGTSGLSRLGANAIRAVSLAVARAVAAEAGRRLWRRLAGEDGPALPVPMSACSDRGCHADNRVPIQKLMLVLAGVSRRAAPRLGSETWQALADILRDRGLPTAVGDEGQLLVGALERPRRSRAVARGLEARRLCSRSPRLARA